MEAEQLSRFEQAQRIFTGILLGGLVIGLIAWWCKGSWPSSRDILPPLLKEPVQGKSSRKEFSFLYCGERYRVLPVASYDLHGLVVSHNDINAWSDIYHSSKSVDTKDVGVIWGKNLRTDDFHKVTIWSGCWTVNWRYPHGVTFDHFSIANNHLITNDETLRAQIEEIRVGDQVRIRGQLVNYQAGSTPNFWRKSSITRKDVGGTACEVVFVESVKVLKRGTPGWYFLYWLCQWAFCLALVAKILLLLHPGNTNAKLGIL